MTLLSLRDASGSGPQMVALGEVLLRLDPGDERIHTTRTFRVWEGGGEYNVARGLRRAIQRVRHHRRARGRLGEIRALGGSWKERASADGRYQEQEKEDATHTGDGKNRPCFRTQKKTTRALGAKPTCTYDARGVRLAELGLTSIARTCGHRWSAIICWPCAFG